MSSAQPDQEQPDIPIGKALRILREGVGITQTEVARRGGPDFRTISHWETGRKHPSLRLLIQYLNALELDLSDLQGALDQIAKRRDRLTSRLIMMEQRLSGLERWRLEMITTALNPAQEGNEPCQDNETSTAS